MADPMEKFKLIDHYKNTFKLKINSSDVKPFDLPSSLSDDESCVREKATKCMSCMFERIRCSFDMFEKICWSSISKS